MQDEKDSGSENPERPPTTRPLTKTGGQSTVPPVQGQSLQAPLDVLINSAAPLVHAYFEHKERMHKREIEFEGKVIANETKIGTILIVSGAAVAIVVLGLAGYLFFEGRDEAAVRLIAFVTAIAGAGFGGWGLARRKHQMEESKD